MINFIIRIAVWIFCFSKAKPNSLERARLAVPMLMYLAMTLILSSLAAISLIENESIRKFSFFLLGLGLIGGFVGFMIWGFYRLHQQDEFDRQLRARDARLLKKRGSDAQ